MKDAPPHADATEVYPDPKKPRRPIPIPGRIDTEDFDQVFDLAVALQTATARRLMAVTHGEMRAIARLAAAGGVALSQAVDLVALVGRGAPAAEIVLAVRAFAAAVRPILEGKQ